MDVHGSAVIIAHQGREATLETSELRRMVSKDDYLGGLPMSHFIQSPLRLH
jgi:hypothetical protein